MISVDPEGLDTTRRSAHLLRAGRTFRLERETTATSGGHLYYFVTVLLGLMIAGFGAGVALGLRMPPAD